jgi:AraC-like DNA-binding protein
VEQQTPFETRLGETLPEILGMGPMLFDPVWAERQHWPSHCEILHLIEGEMVLEIGPERYRARARETLLVPPGLSHRDRFEIESPPNIFFCSYRWSEAEALFAVAGPDALLGAGESERHTLGLLFDHLRSSLRDPRPGGQLLTRVRVLTVLLHAWQRARTAEAGSAGDPLVDYGSARRRELMEKAKAYLAEHYAECVSLDEIAEALHVSGYHLSHVFSDQSDFSLFGYLTALRIEKACALLAETDLRVNEISRKVGYETPNYFSRVFRKVRGCSPREYAARHRFA